MLTTSCLFYLRIIIDTSVADSEARLMNTTYTEAMADRTSAEFRAVAGPFCDEVSILFDSVCLLSKLRPLWT